ncbi:MAG: hypothetical protein ACTSXS_10150 [Candidatus Thorarchaeota archaeon]
MITIPDFCESCGKEIEQGPPPKTLEDNFIREEQRRLSLCRECFDRRFKVITRKSSGYGGTIYELEPKPAPRFGLGSKSFTCLKCSWVAWTEEGLAVHMKKHHGT